MFGNIKLGFKNGINMFGKKLSLDMFKFYVVLMYLAFNFSYVSVFGELVLLVSILNYLFYLVFIGIFIYDVTKNQYKVDLYTILFIIFIMSTVITMYLNSYTLVEYVNEMKFILLGLFQFFIFFNVFNRDSCTKLKILSFMILFICFVSHIFNVIIYIFRIRLVLNKVYGIHYNGSFTGIYDNENILGIICFIGIVFSFIFLSYYNAMIFKQIAVINIILSVIMLFLVNARSAVIAFLFFCFLLTSIIFRKKSIIIGFVIIFMILSLYLAIFNRNLLIFLLNGRYEIWDQVFHVIKNRYLFGYSKTNSINVLINSTIRFLSGAKEGGTHNTFLDIFLSYGLVGFSIVSVFMIVYVFKTYNILRKKINDYNYIILYSAVLSFLFIGMFESVLIYAPSLISIIFWMIMGYVKNDNVLKIC